MSSSSRFTSSPRVLVFALVGTLLVLAGATWFLLVAPKRTQESNIASQLQEAQSTLKASQHIAHHRTSVPLQALAAARALPGSLEMPKVLIDLNRVATADHVTLESITPQAPVAYTAFEAAPFTLIVDGRFFAIEKFLHDLREQVQANANGIRSTGRFFDVQSVSFASGTAAPLLAVTLDMNVFYYLGATPATTATATS
jgi:Tfp pilus assembly protein PilO